MSNESNDGINERRSRSPNRNNGLTQSPRMHSAPSATMLNYSDLKVRMMPGKRETSKVLFAIDEQQLYTYRVKNKHAVQYNCYIKSCSAKVEISNDTGKCSRKGRDTHNPGPNAEISTIELKTAIKKRCRSVAAATRGGGDVHAVFNETIRE